MSQFIGAALPVNIIARDDKWVTRIRDQYAMAAAFAPVNPWLTDQTYRTQFWPGNRSDFFGAAGTDFGICIDTGFWELPDSIFGGGCSSRYGVVGVTRNQYGSILPFVTLKLYRTSTDEMVAQTVSDANGAYLLTTPYYPDTHYIVGYLVGTPDTQGTTVNTIIAG